MDYLPQQRNESFYHNSLFIFSVVSVILGFIFIKNIFKLALQMIKDKQLKYMKAIVLLVIIIVPFSLSDYTDQIKPEKITSDLRFYEINTCSISLNEFLLENPNVIYQDHYKIRFNNYSSISCFGQITGIDQIGYTFYISIGTNTILNLFLQSIFW